MRRPTFSPLEQVRHLRSVESRLLPLGERRADIDAVMTEMERGYEAVADHYGFVCRGCEESCCRTVFYHHTYAEFLLLSEGLRTLAEGDLAGVYGRASEVQARLSRGEGAGPPRAMCPLNREGRCMLYAHRPMICRLHGIPHRLRRPDGQVVNGPGCHRFGALVEGEANVSRRLDRTPYYQRLAQVEGALRQGIEAPIRLNMTLAEWLCACASLDGAEDWFEEKRTNPK